MLTQSQSFWQVLDRDRHLQKRCRMFCMAALHPLQTWLPSPLVTTFSPSRFELDNGSIQQNPFTKRIKASLSAGPMNRSIYRTMNGPNALGAHTSQSQWMLFGSANLSWFCMHPTKPRLNGGIDSNKFVLRDRRGPRSAQPWMNFQERSAQSK